MDKRYDPGALRAFAEGVLRRAGVPEEPARAVAQGLVEDAVGSFRLVIADDRVGETVRTQFRLRLAQAERLRNRLDHAETAYLSIINQQVPVGDLPQWARLWLGDLYLQRGDGASFQRKDARDPFQAEKNGWSPVGNCRIGDRPRNDIRHWELPHLSVSARPANNRPTDPLAQAGKSSAERACRAGSCYPARSRRRRRRRRLLESRPIPR